MQSSSETMKAPPHRSILHVDMDAFYASVELLDNPALAGKPVIVGGLGSRGVVATANYAARKFGVHSAMPMGQARRLCPHGHFQPPRMARYRELSSQVFEIFRRFTPLVEGLSLDEAFLDVSASVRLFGTAIEISTKLKTQIRLETGLTASVGVAHNKFLAKLASDLQKPDGLVVVPVNRVTSFLDPMPIKRLWGVGPKTQPRLQALGILTFGQLRKAGADIVRPVLGNRTEHFLKLAAGEDDRAVIAEHPDKSISHEITFDQDLFDTDELLAELQHLVEAVGQRLRARHSLAVTVSVKIRDASFRTFTRSRSMPAGSNSTMTLYRLARALLLVWRKENLTTPVRLLGMGVSGLEHRFANEALMDSGDQADLPAQQRLDKLLDTINQRYGDAKIVHAMTLRRRRDRS
ncbi:MAG: DNA polymerase IV [Xanthomonadales bacterium]|nr:DNA polymerase IV [Xanthomonadales bacterium]